MGSVTARRRKPIHDRTTPWMGSRNRLHSRSSARGSRPRVAGGAGPWHRARLAAALPTGTGRPVWPSLPEEQAGPLAGERLGRLGARNRIPAERPGCRARSTVHRASDTQSRSWAPPSAYQDAARGPCVQADSGAAVGGEVSSRRTGSLLRPRAGDEASLLEDTCSPASLFPPRDTPFASRLWSENPVRTIRLPAGCCPCAVSIGLSSFCFLRLGAFGSGALPAAWSERQRRMILKRTAQQEGELR